MNTGRVGAAAAVVGSTNKGGAATISRLKKGSLNASKGAITPTDNLHILQ